MDLGDFQEFGEELRAPWSRLALGRGQLPPIGADFRASNGGDDLEFALEEITFTARWC